MKEFIHHLFFPRHSNNHRAKFLHHQSLLFVIVFLLVGTYVITILKANYQHVLGTATNISITELLNITNQKRQEQGLGPLTLNDNLSHAATLKAKYMFAKNFWAHNAPDGTTPWVFIRNVGYNYTYAGENLARGFSSSNDVVDAWMNSPSHRENMLSSNYSDIGFAIMDGNLLGEDTTLVVEMLGNKNELTSSPQPSVPVPSPIVINNQVPIITSDGSGQVSGSVIRNPIIDSKFLTSHFSVMLLLVFISLLVLDIVIVKRRKVERVVGHNIDHILYFVAMIILIIISGKGLTL